MERRKAKEHAKTIVPRSCVVEGERGKAAARRVYRVKGGVGAVRYRSTSLHRWRP